MLIARTRAHRRYRPIAGASLLIAITLTVAGCTFTYPVSRAPDGDPIDAARALTDAPDLVSDANPADSCGEFELGQDQSVPPGATECLDAAALAGRNAQLAWTTPTTEGDPIVWFAFAQPGLGVVVLSTNEFDSHGGEFMWSDFHCPDAVAATSTTSECKTVVD